VVIFVLLKKNIYEIYYNYYYIFSDNI